jgi:hypothetical protein
MALQAGGIWRDPIEQTDAELTLFFTGWNRIGQWLRHVDGLRQRPEPSAAARACAIGKRCGVNRGREPLAGSRC